MSMVFMRYYDIYQCDTIIISSDIDRYLKLVSGIANLSLFNLVRADLLVELRAAIYQAQREKMPVTKSGLCLEESDPVRTVTLQVIPFHVPTAEEHRFLVLCD